MELVLLIVEKMNLNAVPKYLVKTLNKLLMVSIACPNQSLSSIKPYTSTQLNFHFNAYEQNIL